MLFRLGDTASAKLVAAIKQAEELIGNYSFQQTLRQRKRPFAMSTNVTGSQLLGKLQTTPITMTVETYKSFNPWSSANGYFDPARPRTVFVNSRKLNRSMGSIAGTLIHELIHAIDSEDKQDSYGHGDNRWSPLKEQSAPFWVDNVVEAMIDGKPLGECEKKKSVKIKTVSARWYKPWTWFR